MAELEIRFDGPGAVDWGEVFGDAAPVELELGVGKGRFLAESAGARPGVRFVGVERSRKYHREACARVQPEPPPNLRFCHAEAMDFLVRRVPDGSLAALHVYHPDPWPKRRHRRRRLVAPPFLDQAARCLAPGGELRLSTDHAGYAEAMATLLDADARFERLPWDGEESPNTHFEAKYRREGRAIHRFRARRAAP